MSVVTITAREVARVAQDAQETVQVVVQDAEGAILAAQVHARVVVRGVAREDAPDAVDVTQGATVPAHPHVHKDATATAQDHARHVRTVAIAIA